MEPIKKEKRNKVSFFCCSSTKNKKASIINLKTDESYLKYSDPVFEGYDNLNEYKSQKFNTELKLDFDINHLSGIKTSRDSGLTIRANDIFNEDTRKNSENEDKKPVKDKLNESIKVNTKDKFFEKIQESNHRIQEKSVIDNESIDEKVCSPQKSTISKEFNQIEPRNCVLYSSPTKNNFSVISEINLYSTLPFSKKKLNLNEISTFNMNENSSSHVENLSTTRFVKEPNLQINLNKINELERNFNNLKTLVDQITLKSNLYDQEIHNISNKIEFEIEESEKLRHLLNFLTMSEF